MPPLGLPERVQALETALLEDRSRRLALLLALRAWLQDVPDTAEGYEALVAHLEERIEDEE